MGIRPTDTVNHTALLAVSGRRPAGMQRTAKAGKVLEAEVCVLFAVERFGGDRPDADAPVNVEVRHLRGRLEGEEGGKRREHGGREQPAGNHGIRSRPTSVHRSPVRRKYADSGCDHAGWSGLNARTSTEM